MISWPDDVWLTRGVVVVLSALQLLYSWWYLRDWYWLPKASPRRLIGWVIMFVTLLIFPLIIYPANAHTTHPDVLVSGVLAVEVLAFLALLLTMIRRGNQRVKVLP